MLTGTGSLIAPTETGSMSGGCIAETGSVRPSESVYDSISRVAVTASSRVACRAPLFNTEGDLGLCQLLEVGVDRQTFASLELQAGVGLVGEGFKVLGEIGPAFARFLPPHLELGLIPGLSTLRFEACLEGVARRGESCS